MPPKSGYRYRCQGTQDQPQVTPRFSRTSISKIPRQVGDRPSVESTLQNGTQSSTPHYQKRVDLSRREAQASNDLEERENHYINSKYLTFSKDQATSHFKLLREELLDRATKTPEQGNQSTLSASDKLGGDDMTAMGPISSNHQDKTEMVHTKLTLNNERLISDQVNLHTSPITTKPKPLERLSKSQHSMNNRFRKEENEHLQVVVVADDDVVRKAGQVAASDNILPLPQSQPQQQQIQQPKCEAFIMTGEQILKTYTNKSESSCNKRVVTAADTTVTTNTTTTTIATEDKVVPRDNNNGLSLVDAPKIPVQHAPHSRSGLSAEQRGKSISLNKLSDHLACSSKANETAAAAEAGAESLIGQSARIGDTGHEMQASEQSAMGRAAMFSHEQQKPVHSYGPAEGGRQASEEVDPLRANNFGQTDDCEYLPNERKDSPPGMQQKTQDQMDQPPLTSATRNVTLEPSPRHQPRADSSKLNGGRKLEENDFSIEFKTGFLNKKRIFEAKGKPTSKGKRGWRHVYAILRDLRLIVRYGQKEFDDLQNDKQSAIEQTGGQAAKVKKQLGAKDLKNAIRLHHAFAKKSSTYTKREYVFHLQLADQSELLLQASSENEMLSWIDTINFASACLSSPPLPSAVSNSKRYHQSSTRYRLILPASYTKLSYWEQLTDHEERLERLKLELEEHLNEAPIKRHADKRSKSEFIDKIAFMRQKIEHYTVYLDLMQKKSNSPEAIILSKHPQIASLTPSKEMVRSLPLYTKAHEDEDKKDAE